MVQGLRFGRDDDPVMVQGLRFGRSDDGFVELVFAGLGYF
jgi:hypothetical protein